MKDTLPSLASRVSVITEVWKPMLGISEHLKVEVTDIEPADGEGETECAMFPASAVPEAAGRWDFVLAVSPVCQQKDDQDLERVVVHELVHLLMEPLREAHFAEAIKVKVPTGFIVTGIGRNLNESWETVIERLTASYIDLVDRR